MSLHTRCTQRLARRTAHRTVWRQRDVRCYASETANEPEWFQQVRTELLSRKPRKYSETLDALNYQQLRTTLEGFQPAPSRAKTDPAIAPLTRLLTRFNAQLPSSKLLSDGTDPLHSPGGPWERRMWAGGAVRFNPSFRSGSEEVMGPWKKVTCFERIKDVRLQGTGIEAKVFVTIERSFGHTQGPKDGAKRRAKDSVQAGGSQQVGHDDDWGITMLKEERNLVFLKPKTAAELAALKSGQLLVPRYLKSPTDPDYSHSLTPTRSLLFRYSALTFNAHLLHLDLEYTRNIEGHRNLLVHGPLTLTLMLQVLNRHLLQAEGSETVSSIEYRNLAPLYCEEEMRVCVKKRKATDRTSIWDIWIEGPTGGMAVKAVANTIQRGRGASPAETSPLGVRTVALPAQGTLHSAGQTSSGTEPVSSGLSRARPGELGGQEQATASTPSRPVFRKIEAEGSWQPRLRDVQREAVGQEKVRPIVIKKVDQLSVRKVDVIGLREAARKREHQKRIRRQERAVLRGPVESADRAGTKGADTE